MTKGKENTSAVYRGMDQATLDAAYNNSEAVIDSPQWLETWRERSEASRRELDSVLDIRYGLNERNTLDLFLSGEPSAPLFMFIHGGYWQRNDKSVFSFVANGLCQLGIDVVVPGYTLAPDTSLTSIVDEIHRALTYIRSNPERFHQNLDRIIVGGWSAGGHLSALTQGYTGVTGIMPVSGIFDLEPIANSYINDKLQLTRDEVSRLSPMRNGYAGVVPTRIAVGALELPELIRQSTEYADALHDKGREIELVKVPDRNHFSILEELAEPDGLLARMVVELCAIEPGNAHS
jgi:arylformamidase